MVYIRYYRNRAEATDPRAHYVTELMMKQFN